MDLLTTLLQNAVFASFKGSKDVLERAIQSKDFSPSIRDSFVRAATDEFIAICKELIALLPSN